MLVLYTFSTQRILPPPGGAFTCTVLLCLSETGSEKREDDGKGQEKEREAEKERADGREAR